METAAPKQRSPWLYVLLGCGGFALLSCLGIAGVFGFGIYKAKDAVAGLTDRTKATERATKMLGAIPQGYVASGSMSILGLIEMSQLVKGTVLPDGGIEDVERDFTFFKVIANESNKKSKAFFTSNSNDASGLRQNGVNMNVKEIVKRGSLTADSQRYYYVVSRGQLQAGPDANGPDAPKETRLNSMVLFDCPGDGLHIGIWAMPDPKPDEPASALDLTGTVGDEAQLVPFLKQMTPCES